MWWYLALGFWVIMLLLDFIFPTANEVKQSVRLGVDIIMIYLSIGLIYLSDLCKKHGIER
jgi:hypothetical protein